MTLKTWMEEFYQVGACTADKEYAIEHSLRKWEGLRPENLAKHDCRVISFVVHDQADSRFNIASDSCALCVHYCLETDEGTDCESCPLSIARGGHACDVAREDEECSPWSAMIQGQYPEPMIVWLQKTKDAS